VSASGTSSYTLTVSDHDRYGTWRKTTINITNELPEAAASHRAPPSAPARNAEWRQRVCRVDGHAGAAQAQEPALRRSRQIRP